MKVIFEPSGTVCGFDSPAPLTELAARVGINIAADCGGAGVCGRCAVMVVEGAFSPVTESERRALSEAKLALGYRLACAASPVSDARVRVLGEEGIADAKRRAPRLPRGFAPDVGSGLGAAFDIGTTTLAGVLYDLKTGEALSAVSRANPQGVRGADVISRIGACSTDVGLSELHSLIIDAVNGMLSELTSDPRAVSALSVCGNSTMSHIFLNIDPSPLARAPFEPRFLDPPARTADALGVAASPEAPVYMLPLIAGHVGGDITGVLLASDMSGKTLAVDVGTNGEVVLEAGGARFACSTAAGPAFEGASISQGMRAARGAIERVKIIDGRAEVAVIGGARAEGICGSGLIDCVAALLDAGLIDKKGRLSGGEFLLKDGVSVTQKDVREVQLAKAAIAAGMSILMKEAGVTANELDRVLLAGAFGSHIDARAALRIGLLPPVGENRVASVGNAAAAGAAMALLSARARGNAHGLARGTAHIDLAAHPDFQSEFVRHMYFEV